MQSGENVIESCHNCEAVECKIVSNWQYFTFNRFAVMATQPLLPSDYIEGYSYSIAPRLFQHIICILSIICIGATLSKGFLLKESLRYYF